MLPVIYNINNAVIRDKMAAFDYDWTLVNPKDGKTFPKDVDDWMWMYSNIPKKIIQYYEQGYMIVIFTNQSKTWKCNQIKHVLSLLNIPLYVVIATDKTIYKPNKTLFDLFIDNKKINKDLSFYVGDALGRKLDFSDSDKLFAENIGIKWYSPEDIFTQKNSFSVKNISCTNEPEIIIMVGYPGSGKTTIAENICKNEKYIHISGDVYKTIAKMKKMGKEQIKDRKSIVFDAIHSSKKKRSELVDFANTYNYNVRCVHVNTSLDESYKRNKLRPEDKQVPKIAYSVYKKYFEEPNISEGFTDLIIV